MPAPGMEPIERTGCDTSARVEVTHPVGERIEYGSELLEAGEDEQLMEPTSKVERALEDTAFQRWSHARAAERYTAEQE